MCIIIVHYVCYNKTYQLGSSTVHVFNMFQNRNIASAAGKIGHILLDSQKYVLKHALIILCILIKVVDTKKIQVM